MDPTAHRRLALAAGGAGPGGGDVEVEVIDLNSSDSETESDDDFGGKRPLRAVGRAGLREEKKPRVSDEDVGVEMPSGFLDPLPLLPPPPPRRRERSVTKQFWKAGEYDGVSLGNDAMQHSDSGMDHVRAHPKFLHSNATSHKWALGALAELLDNSLDEVANGGTYVNIDITENKKDGTPMLLVHDDGGGMNPDKMRHCMSLGYSAKSKLKNTIGQYGNGFKTSTMRLGADVLVFSRSRETQGTRATQSVGMLSYTFLRSTDKDDIIVPMIDYEKEQVWKKKVRTTWVDWHISLETIIEWSPYSTEAELLQQFDSIWEHGTRIIIYNLWEDEEGKLELDFDADVNDIQIRGANRDQKRIKMANQFPNSKHFFTYRHSLRSYASILYHRVPHVFRMILRGKEIRHHSIINDLMLKQQIKYKPAIIDGFPKDEQMVADVTIGFVKDAEHHIDIQGFNVYHKNRLIKPFWRIWTPAGCQGRGIIGVLEVNFVEPAHDKQDFERTNCLARLEARLVRMQRKYWLDNHHLIGYGNRSSGTGNRNMSKYTDAKRKQLSPMIMSMDRAVESSRTRRSKISVLHGLSDTSNDDDITEIACTTSQSPSILRTPKIYSLNGSSCLASPSPNGVKGSERIGTRQQFKSVNETSNRDEQCDIEHEAIIKKLKDENSSLKDRILMVEESLSRDLQIERDKNKSLIERIKDLEKQLEAAKDEQEKLMEIFADERKHWDQEEENLKKKLQEAASTIQDLMEQLRGATRELSQTMKE